MAVDNSQSVAVGKVQRTLNKINRWTKGWKIKLDELKSIHVTYALRRKYNGLRTFLNEAPVPQIESAKYLGLQIKLETPCETKSWIDPVEQRQMYWLIGDYSKMNLHCKRLIYQSIFKPIWMYGVQLWGCTCKSNREVIQRSQNKFLRMITNS